MPTAEPLKQFIEKKKAEALQKIKNAGQPAAVKQPTPAAGPGFFGTTPKAVPTPAPKPKTNLMPVVGLPGAAIEVPEGIKQPSPMDLVNAGIDLSSRGLYGVANVVKEVTDDKKSTALDVLRAAVRGLSGQAKTTFSDVLSKQKNVLPSRVNDPDVRLGMALMKSSPELASPEFARGVTANVLDVALDPATYIGVGTAKALTKTAGKAVAGTKKAATKALGEATETAATKEARSIAIKETPVPEPLRQIPDKPQPKLKEAGIETSFGGSVVEKPRSFPETVAKGDLTGPELKRLIQENPQVYRPITNKETLDLAQKMLDENRDAMKAVIMSGKKFDSPVESAAAQDLVRRLQNEGKWDEAFEVMAKASEKFTTAGQIVQSASMWRRMTPEGMLKFAFKTFEDANKLLPKGKKIKLADDIQKRISDAMKTVNKMEDGVDKDMAIALVLDEIESRIPITLARKLSTFQAISHLLNGRTAMRNILGNTAFSVAETISQAMAIPFDRVIAKWTGKKTVSLPGIKEPIKEGIKRGRQAAKEAKLGIKTEPEKYDLFRGRTFRKGPLSTLEKGLAYTLRVPDEAFKGYRERQVIDQMKRMAGVDEATEEMLRQATLEARYSTFQDDSLPAKLLQALKETLNKVGVGKEIRGGQVASTREFGLGDFVLKYSRVPGNLISRAIEYTPAGTLKALSILADARKSGVLNQREMALTFGRAMTGSGMISMGAWLYSKGLLLSEDGDLDKDAKAMERAEGLGGFKVNTSAINRYLSGGEAAPQAGDALFSYDWMQPVSVALAVGGTIAAQLQKQKSPAETLTAIGANSVTEILDLPTLFIVKSMVYEGLRSDSSPFTVATVPLAEAVSGFIPGPVRQVAQLTDEVARDTRGETPIESAGKKIQGSLPGVREGLEPRLSPLGEEITYPTGVFTNLLNPATKSIYKPIDFSKQLKALEEATGEVKQYPPGNAPKSFIWRKGRIELTAQEKTEYQRIAGQQIDKRFSMILGRIDVDKLNDGQRKAVVDKLAKVIGESREYAKFQVLRSRLQSAAGE